MSPYCGHLHVDLREKKGRGGNALYSTCIALWLYINIYITGIRVLLLFTIIRSVTFAKNDQIDHGCAFLFLTTLSFFIDQKTINTLVICSGIMLIYI